MTHPLRRLRNRSSSSLPGGLPPTDPCAGDTFRTRHGPSGRADRQHISPGRNGGRVRSFLFNQPLFGTGGARVDFDALSDAILRDPDDAPARWLHIAYAYRSGRGEGACPFHPDPAGDDADSRMAEARRGWLATYRRFAALAGGDAAGPDAPGPDAAGREVAP